MQFIIGIVGLVLAVVGIMDVLKSSLTGGMKALWIVLMIFLPIIGFLIYWFVGRKKA